MPTLRDLDPEEWPELQVLAQNVAFLRKLRGLKQAELAKKVPTTQAFISAVELMQSNIRHTLVISLARALDVTVSELTDAKLIERTTASLTSPES